MNDRVVFITAEVTLANTTAPDTLRQGVLAVFEHVLTERVAGVVSIDRVLVIDGEDVAFGEG